MKPKQKVCILANGCPENRIDGARAKKFLMANNYIMTEDLKEADLILFNACGQLFSRSPDVIKQIKRRMKSSTELIIYGCQGEIDEKSLREVYQGPTFPSDDLESLEKFFESKIKVKNIEANYLLPRITSFKKFRFPNLKNVFKPYKIKTKLFKFYRNLVGRQYHELEKTINFYNPNSFSIKVSNGCLSACSFCSHVFARGRLKSKPLEKIAEEFKEGLIKGHKEFGLIGTDVAAYGRDIGSSLVLLLRELLKNEGEYSVNLRNMNPLFIIKMLPEFTEVLKSGKISYIEMAVQSGNNRILKLMKRGYTIEDYKNAFHSIREASPGIQIRTQIIVNFPSETKEEFQDTLQLLDELDFDYIELYNYRPEPNTKASKLKGRVPEKTAFRRYHKMYMKIISVVKSKCKKNKSALAHLDKQLPIF